MTSYLPSDVQMIISKMIYRSILSDALVEMHCRNAMCYIYDTVLERGGLPDVSEMGFDLYDDPPNELERYRDTLTERGTDLHDAYNYALACRDKQFDPTETWDFY
jgi:hypothetical protein